MDLTGQTVTFIQRGNPIPQKREVLAVVYIGDEPHYEFNNLNTNTTGQAKKDVWDQLFFVKEKKREFTHKQKRGKGEKIGKANWYN